MAGSRWDTVLRIVALVLAVAAMGIVAANPQFHRNSDARARTPLSSKDLQREADAKTKGFAYLLKSGEHRYPGRWCGGTIEYTIDVSQVADAGMNPDEEIARWAAALGAWSRATQGHYRFVHGGQRALDTDDEGELNLDSIQPGTIGITYVHGDGSGDATHDAVAVRGRTAGNGGLQVVSTGDADAGALVGDRGFVMIDAVDAAALSADGLRQTLYTHESGHALGLGHVDTASSLMNGTLSTSRALPAGGDVAGIRALAAMPCEN